MFRANILNDIFLIYFVFLIKKERWCWGCSLTKLWNRELNTGLGQMEGRCLCVIMENLGGVPSWRWMLRSTAHQWGRTQERLRPTSDHNLSPSSPQGSKAPSPTMYQKQMGDYKPKKLRTFLFTQGQLFPRWWRPGHTTWGIHRPPWWNPRRNGHPGTDPLMSSPAKAWIWMHRFHGHLRLYSRPTPSTLCNPTRPCTPPYHFSPPQGSLVMNTTLKDMLMSLQSSLMTDLSSLFHKISTDTHFMGNRVTTIETGMVECTTMVNDIIDIYEGMKEEQDWVRAKLANLEDRSRPNNLKLWGVPKSILPADPPRHVKEPIHTILPDAIE